MTRYASPSTRTEAAEHSAEVSNPRETARPADGEAPSGGWRSVYASMNVSTTAEESDASKEGGQTDGR